MPKNGGIVGKEGEGEGEEDYVATVQAQQCLESGKEKKMSV